MSLKKTVGDVVHHGPLRDGVCSFVASRNRNPNSPMDIDPKSVVTSFTRRRSNSLVEPPSLRDRLGQPSEAAADRFALLPLFKDWKGTDKVWSLYSMLIYLQSSSSLAAFSRTGIRTCRRFGLVWRATSPRRAAANGWRNSYVFLSHLQRTQILCSLFRSLERLQIGLLAW